MTSIPAKPTQAETALARQTSRKLASRALTGSLRVRLLDDADKETISIPAPAVRMLVRILDEMARGNAVQVIPVRPELTTQEAADLLHISRPSLIRLLDEEKIEYHKVGSHRRIRLDQVLAYKRRADSDRRAALAELAAYDQEIGI